MGERVPKGLPNRYSEELGYLISSSRLSLNQSELARNLNRSNAWLCKIEKGDRLPPAASLAALCKALNWDSGKLALAQRLRFQATPALSPKDLCLNEIVDLTATLDGSNFSPEDLINAMSIAANRYPPRPSMQIILDCLRISTKQTR